MDLAGDDQEQTKSDDGVFQPTRRSVLVGAAALAASGPAYADGPPTENFQLDFLDKVRRQIVVLVDASREIEFKSNSKSPVVTSERDRKFLLSWDRREFGPNASFKIERASDQYFKDGRPTDYDKPEDPAKVGIWLPLKWTLTVSRASFPGNEKFPGDTRNWITESTIVFTFERTKLQDEWYISATLTPWWESRAGKLTAGKVLLKDFFNGEAKLSFTVAAEQNRLLSSLFGERIEARTNFDLKVNRYLQWSIDAGRRAAAAKIGRLYILDIPLEFGRLTLTRVRSDLISATDQRAASSAGEVTDKKAADGGKGNFLFETEVIHGRPLRVSNRFFPDGLYGSIEDMTGFTMPSTETPASEDVKPIWTFDFAARPLDGLNTTVALEFDKAAISFDPPTATDRRARVLAAIRHWGYPDHTVAGCVVTSFNELQGIGRLNVKHGPAKSEITEGPFEFTGFEIVRQYHAKADAVITRLSAQPVSKETAVDLQLGSIGVASLPAVSPKPGIAPQVPQIVVEATEAVGAAHKDRRKLSGFSARLALSSASIRLPERIESEPDKPPTHITRLGFREADAQLYLPALGPQPASSADAIIPIGPASAPNKAIIDLGRADLSVLRPSDLLALKFRFSGLELVVPWPPSLDKVAELSPRGGRSPGRPFAQAADGASAPRDERPLLIVEFPPQHVVERAYFKQLPEKLDLPELAAPDGDADAREKIEKIMEALAAPKKWSRSKGKKAADWRAWVAKLIQQVCGEGDDTLSTTGCERTALRKAMRVAANWPVSHDEPWRPDADKALFPNAPPGAGAAPKKISNFDERFIARAAALPEEQRIYIGSDYLEPDARRIALEVLRELKREQEGAAQPIKWPSVDNIDAGEWSDLFRFLVEAGKMKKEAIPSQAWPDLKTFAESKGDALYREVFSEIERSRERRDHDYAAFRNLYALLARDPKNGVPKDYQEYLGAVWFSQVLTTTGSQLGVFRDKLLSASDQETFDTVVPARLSGPSRIAFRVDCEDFEPDRPAGRIPFTLEGLTNWGGMDMAVVRRAERLMEPLQGARLPPRWGRRALTDEGALLHFQGFTSSERWGPAPGARRREPAKAAVSAAQRLAEVYASSSHAPDLFETAIELPFRLFLSPAQDATWMTTAPRVRRDAGLSDDVNSFRELWTARLTGHDQDAGVRAVWSPDYRPEALLSTAAPGAPPIGPYAPWALPRSFGLRNSPDREIERFRTGLESFDRHELVVLSAVHGLPVLGRRAPSGDLAPDADQIEPPSGFRLQGLLPEKVEGYESDMTAIYRPKPLSVNELSLSALGGNLDVDTGFQPPASARSLDRRNLFDALSIERWRQRTVLGRDIVVEVVYKGFLFPLGHRASLVKLTERRFMKVEGRNSPVAILVQRLFLKIGKPEKRYQAEGQPNRGSRWPCERIVMLTRQTPDLVDARSDEPKNGAEAPDVAEVLARGRISLGPGTTGLCMWPRTSARKGAEVWFEMQIGDEAVPVRLPLIFVDNIAANDETTVKKLIDYYNGKAKVANDEVKISTDSGTSPTRKLLRNGQPVMMAPEFKPGDTTFDTAWWLVTAEGREQNPPRKDGNNKPVLIDNTNYIRDSFMEGQDQPPFYPVVDRARCRLKSVERFTGSGPLWADVTFDGDYVAFGIDYIDPRQADDGKTKPAHIYLRIVPEIVDGKPGEDTLPLDFQNRGDLGGGVARPTMDVVAMSRSLGPINGGKEGTPPDQSPPAPPSQDSNALPVLDRVKQFEDSINIFPKGKFLGIMELSKLVEAVLGVDLHPKLTDVIEYGAASLKSAAGDAANGVVGAVAGAATDVRSALTQALISPAADAVAEVQKAWVELANKRLSGEAKVPSLEEIYPQVGQDIARLAGLLDQAKRPETSDAVFFDSLSAILEAARRLTRTIDAIARDPLAAAAGAQVELFVKLRKQIEGVMAAINAFGKLDNLPRELTKIAQDRIVALVQAQAEAMVLSVAGRAPGLAAVQAITVAIKRTSPPSTALTVEIVSKFPADLAGNLRAVSATMPTGDDRDDVEHLASSLEELAAHVNAAKEAANKAKANLDAILHDKVEEIDAIVMATADKLRARAEAAEARALEAAAEILVSRPAVVALRIADAAFRGDLSGRPFDPENLGRTLNALEPALSVVVDVEQAKVAAQQFKTDVCTRVKRTLNAAMAAVMPPVLPDSPPPPALPLPSVFMIDAACFKSVRDDQKLPASCSGSALVQEIHRFATVARDKVALIPGGSAKASDFERAAAAVLAAIGRLGTAQKRASDAVAAIREDVCEIPPRNLPDAFRDLVIQQRALVGAINNLVSTSRTIVTEQLLPNVGNAIFREAFTAVLELLDKVVRRFPELTAFAGKARNAFADALKALADSIGPALPGTAKTLRELAASQVNTTDLDTIGQSLTAAIEKLKDSRKPIESAAPVTEGAVKDVQKSLKNVANNLAVAGETALARIEDALAGDLYKLLADAAAPIADIIDGVETSLAGIGDGALKILADAYTEILKVRQQLTDFVANPASPVIARVLDALAREIGAGEKREFLFQVFGPDDSARSAERLKAENDLAQSAFKNWSAPSPDIGAAMAALGALADAWRQPAVVELIRRFGRIKSAFLRIVVVEALDLRALRSELDRIVRELVPTRATLSYDLGSPVREFSLPGVGKVFLPAQGTRLDVRMRASIDLLSPQKPDARIDGHMGPFGIQLFGDFDVVLLNFRGLDFRAGGGRPSGFDVRFGDFVIGDKAKFLKQLEAYISPKGGLPPVRPMKDKPGIEATYGINLGSFGVGTLSFSNVSLNAGARLPFGATDEAEFIVSIGRSDSPFLISSTIFGGGGYLALLANGKGFIGLETSFDYGGVFTFGFGPLSGTGQITLGLYFRAARGEPARLGMNFMVRAAANIACFSFSVSLFVRLTYVGGQMNGTATFTFSFSIGIDDIDFVVEAFVSQGASAGGGSPTNNAFLDLPGMPALTQFANASPQVLNAYAKAGPKPKPDKLLQKPKLCVVGPAQKTDWIGYRELFDPDLDPTVKISE